MKRRKTYYIYFSKKEDENLEEYGSNSHKAKEIVPIPEKKAEPVVSGTATVQKKTGFGKFANSIFAEDLHNVGSFILNDVIKPYIQKIILDVVNNGMSMWLYGKGASSQSGVTATKVSYAEYFKKPVGESGQAVSSNAFDYNNILYPTRGDAEAVLIGLQDMIDQYKRASVADLYDLSDIPAPDYTANKYGWYNLAGSQIYRNREGYTLKLPKVTVIN